MKRKTADLLQQLRAQDDLLRQRNVNLPSDAINAVKQLKTQVDSLEKGAVDTLASLKSFRALTTTAALINSSQSVDDVLNQVMDVVIHLTGAERGYIVLKNRATGELEFRVARGIDLQEGGGVVVSKTIVNRVADSGEAVLTDNASTDTAYSGNQSIVGFQLRSIMAVPLKVHDEVIGVVYCDNRFLAGLFKPSDLEMLTAFASQSAVAIQNATLFDATRAKLDEVTAMRDRMDNLFTSLDSGIITLTQDGLIIVCNLAAERIVGRDDLIGQAFETALPPLERAVYKLIEKVQQNGSEQELIETTTQDGRVWQFIISPLRDDAHDTLGVAIVLDDLTEQRQSEARLTEVQKYLPAGLVSKTSELDTRPQEREISVIFCDVRGFTTFSEKLAPEELMRVINKYLSLASDAINFVDGVVDKYMGDAVTGLFNTQLNPQDDHAARAVQAALQLIFDLHAQHEVLPPDQRLFYGIGIHTGSAVLGIVGGETRREFSAFGEAADTAKYLQEQALPGEILISQATYERVESLFECERQFEIRRPKAGFEDVAFYRVIKRKRGTGLSSSFIDDELRDLLSDLNLED
jgi:PAS domain S-box-containing protein